MIQPTCFQHKLLSLNIRGCLIFFSLWLTQNYGHSNLLFIFNFLPHLEIFLCALMTFSLLCFLTSSFDMVWECLGSKALELKFCIHKFLWGEIVCPNLCSSIFSCMLALPFCIILVYGIGISYVLYSLSIDHFTP